MDRYARLGMTWVERNAYSLGIASAALFLVGTYLALVWSPPDILQGNAMRILYVHVPTIMIAYLAFFLVLVASVMYLWKRDLLWDRLAGASAELGVLFTALTLVVGSIWAKPIWGVYWTWDPRLTTTAILFVVYAGYLLLRTLQPDPFSRAKQSAVVGIIGFADLPIVHFSVIWWRSLHQGPTFSLLSDPKMDDRMEVALFINLLAFLALFLFLMGQRLRLGRLEQTRDELLWEEAQRV
ncbi:MAG: cytochrome c biogenesis protein CcsA [Chloroflexota bacterium]